MTSEVSSPAAGTHPPASRAVAWPAAASPAHRSVPAGTAYPGTGHAARIMMVDDEPLNTKAVQTHLEIAGFTNFVAWTDDSQALKQVVLEQPDVLLLDIMMPHVSGLDVLQALRAMREFVRMPVIILTSIDDRNTKALALELGATDFLTKPVDPTELAPRVRNAVLLKEHYDSLHRYAEELERQVRLRTAELEASRLEVIHCLARAAEFRDNETGRHVIRVGRYAGIIARGLNLDPLTARLIEHAAPLHDVGKIGIPDAILLKPGRLSEDEFQIIQQHCHFGDGIVGGLTQPEWRTFAAHTSLGASVLEVGRSPLLEMAASIAVSHHEKWDGSGYPCGLAGESIPLEGRIVAVADVFDALGTRRPYKPAFPLDRCFEILREGRGTHFDPQVLDAFFACQEEIEQVYREYADSV